jgi:DNA-binding GntR family transcriptional regulator
MDGGATIVAARAGKLERRSVAAVAAEAIRRRILSGELGEGINLRQDALADELGTSRVPVREALRQLEAEGLVTLLPHRGAVVSPLCLDEISEIFDLRARLEPDLLAHAMPRMRPNDLTTADAILRDYERTLAAGDVHAWGQMNTWFHLALYSPSGRRRSLTMVHGLLSNADRYGRLHLVLTGSIDRAQTEHRELLRLCAIGAIEPAVQLLRRHIESTGLGLLNFLKQHQHPNECGDAAPRRARA